MFKQNVDKIIESNDSELRKLQMVILEILKVIDKICKENNINYWIDAGTLLGAKRHGGFIPWDDDCDICMMREDYNKFQKVIKNELPEGLIFENKNCKNWSQKDVDIQPSFLKIFYLDHFKGFERASGLACRGTFVDIFPMDPVNVDIIDSKLGKILNKVAYFRKSKPQKFRDYFKIFLQKLSIEELWINKCSKLDKYGKADYIVYGVDTPFLDRKYMQKKDTIFPLSNIAFEGIQVSCPNKVEDYLEKMYGDYMQLPSQEERIPHILNLRI